MTDDADQLERLLAYVQAEGRICPQPDHWNRMWDMLPDKRRVGGGWSPALPLILGGWWYSTDLDKRLRLREHIEYAAERGVLTEVDLFLRGLSPEQWYSLRNK